MKKFFILLALGLLGWALCGSIMGIGMSVTTMETTLIIHLFGAPVIFGIISLWYFRKFHYTSPLQTAGIFLSFVVIMDGGLVAPVSDPDGAPTQGCGRTPTGRLRSGDQLPSDPDVVHVGRGPDGGARWGDFLPLHQNGMGSATRV